MAIDIKWGNTNIISLQKDIFYKAKLEKQRNKSLHHRGFPGDDHLGIPCVVDLCYTFFLLRLYRKFVCIAQVDVYGQITLKAPVLILEVSSVGQG